MHPSKLPELHFCSTHNHCKYVINYTITCLNNESLFLTYIVHKDRAGIVSYSPLYTPTT